MRVRFSAQTSIRGTHGPIIDAHTSVVRAFETADPRLDLLYVSCGTTGKHSRTSLHYVGMARDYDVPGYTPTQFKRAAQMIREDLGPEFDVVVETTHIHVEFQPKRGVKI
jgi:hypothetical protein